MSERPSYMFGFWNWDQPAAPGPTAAELDEFDGTISPHTRPADWDGPAFPGSESHLPSELSTEQFDSTSLPYSSPAFSTEQLDEADLPYSSLAFSTERVDSSGQPYPDPRFVSPLLDASDLPYYSKPDWVHHVKDDDLIRISGIEKDRGLLAFCRDPTIPKLKWAVWILLASACANGWCTTIMPGLLNIESFKRLILITETDSQTVMLGLVISSLSMGSILGVIPAHRLMSKNGRKVCVAIGSAIMVIGSVLGAVLPGRVVRGESARTLFIGLRMVIGCGLGLSQAAVPALLSEILHPRYRGTIMFWYNTFWYWGGAAGALSTASCLVLSADNNWTWRVPYLLQAIIPAVQVITILLKWVPESPRYFLLNDKPDTVVKFLIDWHGEKSPKDKMLAAEYYQLRAMHEEEARENATGFKQVFRGGANQRRLFICFMVSLLIQWSGSGVLSYYVFRMLQMVGIHNVTLAWGIWTAIQLWNIIMASVGGWLCERHRRRPLWFWTALAMFFNMIAITVVTAFYDNQANDPNSAENGNVYGGVLVVLIFTFFMIFDLAFTPMQIGYLVEIYPYHLRARGITCNWFFIFLNGAVAQLIHPTLFELLQWHIYPGYVGVLLIFSIVIYCYFPETFKMKKEEVEAFFLSDTDTGTKQGSEERKNHRSKSLFCVKENT